MPDAITAEQLNALSRFVAGLNDLTAATGIAVGWYGPINLTVRDDDGDHTLFDLTSEIVDDVVIYRIEPQR